MEDKFSAKHHKSPKVDEKHKKLMWKMKKRRKEKVVVIANSFIEQYHMPSSVLSVSFNPHTSPIK